MTSSYEEWSVGRLLGSKKRAGAKEQHEESPPSPALAQMGMTQPLRVFAASKPSHSATKFNDRVRSWADLQVDVARLASSLQSLGVRPGDRVGILALNSDQYSLVQFAVWWSGGVVVPMNVRWTPAENAYSLNDSGAKVLFADSNFAPMAPAILAEAADVKSVIYMGDGDAPEGMLSIGPLVADSPSVPDMQRAGEELAGLYYTGGTTGFPKGVMLPHRALWYNSIMTSGLIGFQSNSVYLHAAPMFHLADGALSAAATALGGTHVYIPAFNPGDALSAIEEHRVTDVLLVPTMIAMLLQHPSFDATKLKSLRSIVYGASPMPEGVLREAMTKLPHVNFFQVYGQTELAPLATCLTPENHILEGPEAVRLRSAGAACPGVEIRIVDEQREDVAPGEVGEIAVSSPGVMLGYWNKPEQTEAALQNGWLLTGDGGRRDEDGFVYIVDRIKDMIVTGGENVFSAEVESAISTHPAVAEVAVIGIPAEKWGEAVHAIVVLRADAKATEEEIIDHCRTAIANYKLPRSVSFRKEPLPLSGPGKILKRELRKPYWEGAERQVS